MANFFTDIFSAGASSLVETVRKAIDDNVTSDEERKALDNELAKAAMQHEVAMATIGLQDKQSHFADTASARENQSRVQESEHASWIAKNVHSILALGIIGLTFFMYWYIVFSKNSETVLSANSAMKDVVIYILGALTTVATQVVSYFFGSSSGSADKSKTLNALANRPNEP